MYMCVCVWEEGDLMKHNDSLSEDWQSAEKLLLLTWQNPLAALGSAKVIVIFKKKRKKEKPVWVNLSKHNDNVVIY